ncbi:MAG: TatD family hydrolase [Caldisericaceae bacterium]
MLIDSHAHVLKEYYSEEEIKKNLTKDILINVVAYDLESSKEAISLAHDFENVFSSIGFHPYDVPNSHSLLLELERLLTDTMVIALGEIGLDYFRDITPKDLQKDYFEKQIDVAKKMDLPIVIHSRQAFLDTIAILDNTHYYNGVFHSFDYSKEEAKKVLDRGFFISFSGMVTFKNRSDLRDALSYVPLSKLLFETDSPYLSPVPLRGKRNIPQFVEYVYKLASEIKNIPYKNIVDTVCNNFFEIFRKANLKVKKEVVCSRS